MDGILLVDKPLDWTSFDVVAKIRGVIRSDTGSKLKVGHSGTLDPKATGLLVILLGSYTKKAELFTKLDKTYQGSAFLGKKSTTADEEGVKTAVSKRKPEAQEISQVLKEFLGDQQQLPPIYSAIKVDGQRAYKMARRGQKPELKPRSVHIFDLNLISYEYPIVEFKAKVSSGTFIRSLAEDLGEKLGTGAYLSSLRRLKVGNFDIAQAISLKDLQPEHIKQALQTL